MSLDVCILLWISRLNKFQRDASLLCPCLEYQADIFRSIVTANRFGLPAPFDDPIQAADDTLCWQREISLDNQAFSL